jgi:hypothetical protein
MRSHWHDNDVIDRLKQVAKEIGISIQVPHAKKLDMLAIKEEAAKNLEELKLQLDKAGGGADAAAAEKKAPTRSQPAVRPEKLLDVEEEKLHRAKSYERELAQRRQQMERKLEEMQKFSADLDKKVDPSDEMHAAGGGGERNVPPHAAAAGRVSRFGESHVRRHRQRDPAA